MRDFDSDSFKRLLSRYEHSKREGKSCYLDSDDYVDLSDYYLDHDRPKMALKVADEGLLCHPDDDLLPVVRAGVLIYLHRFDEAEALVATLSAEVNYDVTYLRAQLAYAAHDNPQQANELFEQWIGDVEREWGLDGDADDRPLSNDLLDGDDFSDEVSPEDAEREVRDAYLHVVMSYVELGNTDRERWVRHWIHNYLVRFPMLGNYDSDLGIADVCREEGYLDLVEEVFQRLLDTDPYMQNGWTILGAAQQSNEKYEEALNSLGFALAINPDDTSALLTQAHTYYALHNYADALPLFMKFRRLTELHSEDQYIAFCYLNLEELELSLKYWKSAYEDVLQDEVMDDNQRAWRFFEISDGLCIMQQYELSQAVIQHALEIDAKNIDYRLQQATVLLGMEDTLKASKCFASIMVDNPEHYHSLLFAIAIRYLAYDYVEIAESMLLQMLETKGTPDDLPPHSHVYAYLAMAQFQNGHVEDALSSLKIACDQAPEVVGHLFSELIPKTVLPQDYFDYLKKQLTQRKNDSTHRSRNPLNDITHSSSPFTKRDGDENEEANDLPF